MKLKTFIPLMSYCNKINEIIKLEYLIEIQESRSTFCCLPIDLLSTPITSNSIASLNFLPPSIVAE